VNSFPQLQLLLQSHLKDGMVGSGSYDDFCGSSVDLVQSWIFTLADFVSAKSLQGDSL
jgi:hypothetical protein